MLVPTPTNPLTEVLPTVTISTPGCLEQGEARRKEAERSSISWVPAPNEALKGSSLEGRGGRPSSQDGVLSCSGLLWCPRFYRALSPSATPHLNMHVRRFSTIRVPVLAWETAAHQLQSLSTQVR